MSGREERRLIIRTISRKLNTVSAEVEDTGPGAILTSGETAMMIPAEIPTAASTACGETSVRRCRRPNDGGSPSSDTA